LPKRKLTTGIIYIRKKIVINYAKTPDNMLQ